MFYKGINSKIANKNLGAWAPQKNVWMLKNDCVLG
jgi:hypothetical protein